MTRIVCHNCRLGIWGEPIIETHQIYVISSRPFTAGPRGEREAVSVTGYFCSERCKDEFLKKREEVRKQRNELMTKNGESRRSRSSGRFYQRDETRRAPVLLDRSTCPLSFPRCIFRPGRPVDLCP